MLSRTCVSVSASELVHFFYYHNHPASSATSASTSTSASRSASAPTTSSAPASSVKFFLIDCRPTAQYDAGHLPCAFHCDPELVRSLPHHPPTTPSTLIETVHLLCVYSCCIPTNCWPKPQRSLRCAALTLCCRARPALARARPPPQPWPGPVRPARRWRLLPAARSMGWCL